MSEALAKDLQAKLALRIGYFLYYLCSDVLITVTTVGTSKETLER